MNKQRRKAYPYLLSLLLSMPAQLFADDTELSSKILPYQNNSFSPTQGDSLAITVQPLKPAIVAKVTAEIRSSDDDLIRTLTLDSIDKQATDMTLSWDGKDDHGDIVPNESYYPVITITDSQGNTETIDRRSSTGGEEVYDFEKNIRPGIIEYTLPVDSRVLIRSGIQNGPMLRTVVDWQPKSAGFHAERWSGRGSDNIIAIDQNPSVAYLIIGYRLPDHSIITYGNSREDYRHYRERKAWPLKQVDYSNKANRLLERHGNIIRPESYTPVLQQKSPRINLMLSALTPLKKSPNTATPFTINGFDELTAEVNIHPLDEVYLDQERYEVSFFVDNNFIAEEEQGYVPFTWRWSPGRYGIKPGKHILTVNISGYNGQVGVKNIVFHLTEDKKLAEKRNSQ